MSTMRRLGLVSLTLLGLLLSEGTILGHYYVMHCCTPTRSAIHTGRYNIRYGLQTGVIPNNKPYGLNLTEALLPEYMRNLGYDTHALGKVRPQRFLSVRLRRDDICLPNYSQTHTLSQSPCCPLAHNILIGECSGTSASMNGPTPLRFVAIIRFMAITVARRSCSRPSSTRPFYPTLAIVSEWLMHNTAFIMVLQDYYTHKDSGIDFHIDNGPNCGPNCSQTDLNATGTYSTLLYADRARQIIAAHNTSKPLFMYMAFQSVHCPIQAPASYVAPYAHLDPNRQVFAGMVAAMDEAIGNITSALHARSMFDNTLIIFTTDNGGPVGSHNDKPQGIGCATGSQNYPLRGGKGAYFQGGVRGTAWVHGAQVHPALRGTTNYNLMHAVDWLPTLVDLGAINGSLPNWHKPLDGVSQYPMLFENAGPQREHALINIERSHPTTAPCQGPQCSPTSPACNGVGQYAVMKGRYKLLLGGGGLPNNWYHDDHPYNGTAPTPQDQCLVACCQDCCDAVPAIQLYDVLADEGEHYNLAPTRPDLVADLMTVVHLYNTSTYVEALLNRIPVNTSCPYNNAQGILTPFIGASLAQSVEHQTLNLRVTAQSVEHQTLNLRVTGSRRLHDLPLLLEARKATTTGRWWTVDPGGTRPNQCVPFCPMVGGVMMNCPQLEKGCSMFFSMPVMGKNLMTTSPCPSAGCD
ncbi:uncharacterized protein MONBRDRAFT_28433 [Monosiga brevicollis MX1]|uniref:Sulfatase N-terminal domain-containing protein n=1 Tax=Monosiga brevicollis TaxID=81824 RepID=A9V857_MONBE|nr:uncharacterized protein MONBRDRAFT_28433 [Monosiga brevicollis MX1]EDQ86215.1 predicted protein [Monosiga brevicollis MX1]|eukprot:XP_001748885.1 hypothetical protein [Monosiga brevicollis MX1]